MSILEQWLAESKDTQREFNQERLIVDVAELITKTLNESSMNQATLARELGKSKGYVSQLLNGSRNMTLRTLADIATELDKKVEFKFIDENTETWVKSSKKTHNQNIKITLYDFEKPEKKENVSIKHKRNYIFEKLKNSDEFFTSKSIYDSYSKKTIHFDSDEYINTYEPEYKIHMAMQ